MLCTLYWRYSVALPWVLALLATTAVVLVFLYLPPLRRMSGGLRWLMPLLRLFAMGALVVSILRPVISRPRNDRERGPVLVLLDNSRSMGVVDTGRAPGQWVAIAAALGRLPGSLRDTDLQEVQHTCDRLSLLADDVARARAERDYAKLSGGSVESATLRLNQKIHELQSTAHDAADSAAKFAHGESLERSLAYLSSAPAGTDQEVWLDHLAERAHAAATDAEQDRITNDSALYRSDVTVRDACEPLQSMSRLELSRTVAMDNTAGLASRLGPDVPVVVYTVGNRTAPVPASVLHASESAGAIAADGDSTNLTTGIHSALASLGNTPVRAIVLFSDGRQVDADSPQVPVTGVPVFTFGAAARSGLRDLTITDVSLPSAVYVGETIDVRVLVRAIGLTGQSTVITLQNDGNTQSRVLKIGDDRPMPVDFKWTAKTGGAQRLVVEAARLPGELSLVNNRVERWVKVFTRKSRIGIAASGDGQDVEIARRAISATPWAELTQVAVGNTGKIPWSPGQISQMDVVLLSGIRANAFSPQQWDAIARLSEESGGSVILAPADNGSLGDTNPVLAKLLPFARSGSVGWRIWPTDHGGFQLGPAAGVHALDFGDSGDAFWPTLAPVSRYLPIAPLKQGVRTLLVESESGTPVLTESRLGRGRVFCIGTNETWRWRASNPEYPERFWGQLLRYASSDPYQAHDGAVSLDADHIAVTPGRPIRLRVRIAAGSRDPASVKALLFLDGKLISQRPLISTGFKGSGIFETTVADLPEGDYEIQADAGLTLGRPRIPLHVHPSSEAEMVDLSGDEGWLRRLAESGGGQYFRFDQTGQLPQRLLDLPVDLSHPVELSLWDSQYLYALVLGCFAAEWGLRKRFGLA